LNGYAGVNGGQSAAPGPAPEPVNLSASHWIDHPKNGSRYATYDNVRRSL
jgi:hypothetical protein